MRGSTRRPEGVVVGAGSGLEVRVIHGKILSLATCRVKPHGREGFCCGLSVHAAG